MHANSSTPTPLRVAAKSPTTAVAGAIAWSIRDRGEVYLEAVGASAINQASKAIAVATGYLLLEGLLLATFHSFFTASIEGQDRTGLRFRVITLPMSQYNSVPTPEVLPDTIKEGCKE